MAKITLHRRGQAHFQDSKLSVAEFLGSGETRTETKEEHREVDNQRSMHQSHLRAMGMIASSDGAVKSPLQCAFTTAVSV
jgi:hypothetical protein